MKQESVKPKLLILPSWYISERDQVNGSFFQAQSQLVCHDFDTRVISVRFKERPSARQIITSPIAALKEWSLFLFQKDRKINLPDEEIFNNPQLFLHEKRSSINPFIKRHQKVINAWINEIDGLIHSGWRPDLIRAHSAFPAGVVACHAKVAHGIPYAISEHLPFTIYAYEKELRPEIIRAFNNADIVLSLSYDKVRQLAMSDIDVQPNIIFNYVDERRFKTIAKKYNPGAKLKLVTIGASSHYKDHKTLLEALSILQREKIPFHMTMIGLDVWGKAEEKAKTLSLISKLGLENKIDTVGRLMRDDIARILPGFNIFVMTSIQEGFPNSVLEALASGLFVVATRHGGTEDLVDDTMGRITRIKDPTAIASILKSIFEGNIKLCPSRIRDSVVRRCGRESYSKRIVSYYHSLLHK